MRTTTEIRRKIDEYLERLEHATDPETQENICRTLDALLWVIEDASGAAI